MSEKPKKKETRSGAWAEVKDFHEPKSGLTVVVKERIRGAPAYSLQLIHIEQGGRGNQYVPAMIGPIKDLQSHDGKEVHMEDVVFSLMAAARAWILERKKKASEKSMRRTEKKGKDGKRGGKDGKPREKKSEGGLSALAKKDAQHAGHDYKSPSARKKEKRAQAKQAAQES